MFNRIKLVCCSAAIMSAGMVHASEVFNGVDSITPRKANNALSLEASTVQTLQLVELPSGDLELSVMLGDDASRIRFQEHSIRTDAYQLLEQQADGSLLEIEPGPISTYRGSDPRDASMKAALSFEDDGFRVLVLLEDGARWWVEPLAGKVRNAIETDYAVYRGRDIISPDGFCGVDDSYKLPGLDLIQPFPQGMSREILVAEFVADTDYEFYQNYGSSSAVETRINSLMNSINLLYETQHEIVHEIQAIVVRPQNNDPYSSSSIETRLDQVRSEWNSIGNPAHDVVQLFSGQPFDGSTIGLAYVGAVCSSFEYSVVESDCCGSFGCATDLSNHELGHNWGANHCECPNNTMNPSLTCANNFSTDSRGDISSFRNSIESCLDEFQGACCTSNGQCIFVSEAICDNGGGEYQGDGVDCASVTCVDLTGACCLASGECLDGQTSQSCSNSGGEYQGDGSECAQVTCEQPDPTGACCLASGQCLGNQTLAACANAGGDYQGNNSDCGSVTCDQPEPTGACCLADGSCLDSLTSSQCSGTWQGEGTSCAFVDCGPSEDYVELHHAIVGSGLLSGSQDNWTVDVYASVAQGSRVDAVAGNAAQQKLISSSAGFYQDPNGGPTSVEINPNFYSFVPDLEWDSRVTIGALDQTGNQFGSNNLGSVGINWSNFENGGTLSVDNGTWYVLPTDNQGEAELFVSQDCSEQYGVLIARLTAFELDSTISVEALIQGRDQSGSTWQDSDAHAFTFEPFVDCNENGVSDTCDILNGSSQDQDGNGIPDECEGDCPADVNGDNLINVDDILVTLGNYGGSGAGDANGDGQINVDDLLIILGEFGSDC
ncbi:MAG: M12 family metallo-peptidase [Phycisphaerales bacterium]|nr:M12 family metallo-peptidase [Phycisphaerales bacterium]